ncbi:rCG61360, partial [Rattus norvegicus]
MGTRDRTTARAAPSNAYASFGDSVKTEYPFLLSSSLFPTLGTPTPFMPPPIRFFGLKRQRRWSFYNS